MNVNERKGLTQKAPEKAHIIFNNLLDFNNPHLRLVYVYIISINILDPRVPRASGAGAGVGSSMGVPAP